MKDIPLPYKKKHEDGIRIYYYDDNDIIIGVRTTYKFLLTNNRITIIKYHDEKTNIFRFIRLDDDGWTIRKYIGNMRIHQPIFEYKDSEGGWWSKEQMPDTPCPFKT